MNESKYYVFVALNSIGERKLEGDYCYYEEKEIKTLILNEEEKRALFPLFTQFNRAFDIIIDDFEEERLQNKDIEEAIQITQKFTNKHSGKTREACDKLMDMLITAKQGNTYVFFIF